MRKRHAHACIAMPLDHYWGCGAIASKALYLHNEACDQPKILTRVRSMVELNNASNSIFGKNPIQRAFPNPVTYWRGRRESPPGYKAQDLSEQGCAHKVECPGP